jgi:hypothetical protein
MRSAALFDIGRLEASDRDIEVQLDRELLQFKRQQRATGILGKPVIRDDIGPDLLAGARRRRSDSLKMGSFCKLPLPFFAFGRSHMPRLREFVRREGMSEVGARPDVVG